MRIEIVARLIVLSCVLSLSAGCDERQPLAPTSPDGTTATPPELPRPIVRAPATTGRIAFVSDRDGDDAIFIANPDGSDVKRLTVGHEPDWAPGGRQLAFGRDGGIYTIDIDNSREARVTSGGFPAWSPDGHRLVFVRNASIETINADGSQPRRVFNAATWNTQDAEY